VSGSGRGGPGPRPRSAAGPGGQGGALHVSLDVSAVPGQPVGAGRYTVELARALARRADVGLTLWTRRGDARRWLELVESASPSPGPPRVVRSSAPDQRPLRLAWEQLVLPRLLASSGAAVHHGPHYTMPARSPVPVVVTVHDLTFFDHPEWHQRVKVPLFRHAIRRAARRARALVCVSDHTAGRLRSRLDVAGEVFVVPHGVDHERFRPEGADDDAALGAFAIRRPYVLFLGTLEPRKAVPDLVRAFAVVARRRSELSLVLAGRPGWGTDDVRRAIEETAMAERVRLTGYVAEAAVPPLLRNAAVVAYPAHEEGFGLPALEALACGVPLVTTAGTAMAELAGDAAFVVPPGAVSELAGAIEAALSDGGQREMRRRRGLAIAAHHSWDRSAEGHLAAYRWAAGGSGRPGRRGGTRPGR
jgi:glycosyltransferase involved in cell wall biosynthesis